MLLIAPLAWKRMVTRLLELLGARLRASGAFGLVVGLVALWWVRC